MALLILLSSAFGSAFSVSWNFLRVASPRIVQLRDWRLILSCGVPMSVRGNLLCNACNALPFGCHYPVPFPVLLNERLILAKMQAPFGAGSAIIITC